MTLLAANELHTLRFSSEATTWEGAPPALLGSVNLPKINHYDVDFGGGALGSTGNNCFDARLLPAMTTALLDVDARNNWWGQAGGPTPGQVVAVGAAVDSSSPHNLPCA